MKIGTTTPNKTDAMKRLNLYCMALAVLAMGSCSLEHESIVPEELPGLKFTAVWSDEASRTSLDENGTSVLWDPGDEIFVFQGVTAQGPSAMGKFKSTNAARQAQATFTGTMEGECSGDYIAVYPYHPFHEFGSAMDMSEYGYGGYMVAHMIYPVQQGVEGSFALRTAPAAAVSSTNELVFHNICGGVRFSVTRSGIKKVSFSSVDGSPMSGMAYIIIGDDGLPMAMMGGPEELGGKAQSFVDVVAPEGGFVPGKNYYAMMAPQAHAEGIKITLYSDDGMAEKTLSGPITVKRSVFGKLDDIDSGLAFARKTPVPEIVDLGLSVKWASCNLGASAPEGYGDYYAWGETAPKAEYTEYNYKWQASTLALKYTLSPSIYNVDPAPDNKWVLDPGDDAAVVNLGGSWRMPTAEEFEELASGCTWTEETVNGIKGMRATSKVSGYTDQSIFIPYAGGKDDQNSGVDFSSENYIWSSSNLQYPDTESYYAGIVCTPFSFYPWGQFNYFGFRFWGLPVRPVYAGEVVHVTGVELNESSLELEMGKTTQLVATVAPEDASNKRVIWSSSDESIAMVSEDGIVSGVGVGTAEIMAMTVDGGFTAACSVKINYAIPEMVDLGLPSGVKWASFNLGASKPEGYGEYFAWGETEPNSDYSWSTYKWCMGRSSTLTKYCIWYYDGYYDGYNYYTDNNTELDSQDDAASANLGGSWRMPTLDECKELLDNCSKTWTTRNGIYGRLVTGPNGNSIFLPAAGTRYGTKIDRSSGNYWSSSLNSSLNIGISSNYAGSICFSPDYIFWGEIDRENGRSVRPVCD